MRKPPLSANERTGAAGIRPRRIAPWPDDESNPYQRLFYDALAPHGAHCVRGLTINDAALDALSSKIDVVHLHWPEYAWRVHGEALHTQLRLVVGLWRFLRHAKRLGLSVWWTAHNLVPHEGQALVNYLGYRLVCAEADLVIAHSPFAAREVRRRYGARQVTVMPIGNFAGVYPTPRPREEVLAALGLNPDLPVLACVGAVRRYKGILTAVDAVAKLNGRAQLIVAGDPKPDAGADTIQARVQGLTGVRLLLGRLSDQDFADFINASDAVLLPYLRATTSAVLLAAWTLGRGVVASDLPCFADELADHPDAGVLAPVGDVSAYANAIERYLERDRSTRAAAALQASAAHEWSRCVLPLAEHIRAQP